MIAEIEVSLPLSNPLAIKSVLNCFRVERVRGVSSNALYRLKYPVRREANKILHTEVTDSGLYAVVTVTQDAELDDREMPTQACFWFISFIDFVQRPLSPGFIPGLCN